MFIMCFKISIYSCIIVRVLSNIFKSANCIKPSPGLPMHSLFFQRQTDSRMKVPNGHSFALDPIVELMCKMDQSMVANHFVCARFFLHLVEDGLETRELGVPGKKAVCG